MALTDQWLKDLDEWRKEGPRSNRGPRPPSPRARQEVRITDEERLRWMAGGPNPFTQLQGMQGTCGPLQGMLGARTGLNEMLRGQFRCP